MLKFKISDLKKLCLIAVKRRWMRNETKTSIDTKRRRFIIPNVTGYVDACNTSLYTFHWELDKLLEQFYYPGERKERETYSDPVTSLRTFRDLYPRKIWGVYISAKRFNWDTCPILAPLNYEMNSEIMERIPEITNSNGGLLAAPPRGK